VNIDDNIAEVCRELSKSGTLEGCRDYLRNLSPTTSPQDALALSIFFRDHAERYETEWREGFIALFPQSEPLLPSIDDAEYWQDELFGLIRSGNQDGIVSFLQRIGLMNQAFDPKRTYLECAKMGHRDRLVSVPFDFYPIEGGDGEGIFAVTLAQSLGQTGIAKHLQDLIAELHAKYLTAFEQGRLEAHRTPP
jgi:hypothetical protein